VVSLAFACALLFETGAVAQADSTIEVIKGTSKGRVRPGEGRVESRGGETASPERAFPRVEVFVTDWCPYCQRLEAFLKENGVPYERKNIEAQESFRKEHAQLGGGGIPLTRIDGRQVVRGFSAETMGRVLGIDAR
jgi:glutaredoxin